MAVRRVTVTEAPVLAALADAAMTPAWSVRDFAELLVNPATVGLLARSGDGPRGFLLMSVLAGEGEILTLAVAPAARRRGLGGRLLAEAVDIAAAAGATRLFLEVAVDNAAAIGLYRAAGFSQVGRRPGYYRAGRAAPVDALCLARHLAEAGP